jgi:hypothetical protein
MCRKLLHEPRKSMSYEAWPMVETAAAKRQPASSRQPSEVDAQEHAEALRAEARTGLARGGRPPPSLSREAARALVEAGYLPLPDYLALYGDAIEQQNSRWSLSVTARVTAAATRRNVYRATSIRYALPRLSDRVFHWRRRA